MFTKFKYVSQCLLRIEVLTNGNSLPFAIPAPQTPLQKPNANTLTGTVSTVAGGTLTLVNGVGATSVPESLLYGWSIPNSRIEGKWSNANQQ